jgi:hypothetical protein
VFSPLPVEEGVTYRFNLIWAQMKDSGARRNPFVDQMTFDGMIMWRVLCALSGCAYVFYILIGISFNIRLDFRF